MRSQAARRAVRLAVEHGVDDFYQGAVPALIPMLVLERGWDYTRAGGIILAATALSAVAQPLFGVLADRRRAPWLRPAGLLTAAAGIAAVGLTASYPATWTAVLLSGLGIAAYHPEAARAVHATDTGDRGMGWFTFGGLAGFAAGPPLVGLLVGNLGLATTPVLALPALLAAAAYPWTRAAPAADHPGSTVHADDEDWPRFGWLTGVVVARSVVFYGLSAFLAVFVVQRFHSGPVVAVIVLSVFTGAGAVASLASGRLVRCLGRTGVLRASYLVTLFLLGAPVIAPSPLFAIISSAALGAALNVPVPVHTTLGQAYLPGHLGLAAAVTLGLAVSAGGLASPALGGLADHEGMAAALVALLGFGLLAVVLTAPLRDPG